MTTPPRALFDQRYQSHINHLKLQGLRPKTIDAYARAIRRIGAYFDFQIDELSHQQLTDYFGQLSTTHSMSAVKLDLYGLKFYTEHVLRRPWTMPRFVRPAKVRRLPNIVTIEQAQQIFDATACLSYRVFFYTLYSLGLRLSEALALQPGDIDAVRMRVHVRNAKGNRDRLVPLPVPVLDVLRRFWREHRNPHLIFPNRQGGLAGSARATTPLDRGGVQQALKRVTEQCGLKKTSHLTACATATPPT
jgi:integrase/recombinase XerD